MDETSDCTPCRLIGGFGCIGIGAYVGFMGTKSTKNPYGRLVIALLGVGFAGVGVARLLGIRPFSKRKKEKKESIESS